MFLSTDTSKEQTIFAVPPFTCTKKETGIFAALSHLPLPTHFPYCFLLPFSRPAVRHALPHFGFPIDGQFFQLMKPNTGRKHEVNSHQHASRQPIGGS